MPSRRAALWQSRSLQASRRRRFESALFVVLCAILLLLVLFRLGSWYGWDSILDWAVVGLPFIAGLWLGLFPVRETTFTHKAVFIGGGTILSAMIYLQQYRTRQTHSLELASLATKEDIAGLPSKIVTEILKVKPNQTKEVPCVSPVTPPKQQSVQPSEGNKLDISKGLEELKHLIVGQTWGLNADQLTLLSRRLAPYTSNREYPNFIECVMGDPNSANFATNLLAAFRAAGWKLPASAFSYSIFSGNPVGITIKIHSREAATAAMAPPGLREFSTTLREAGIEPVGEVDEKIAEGTFQIIVGRKP